MGVHKNEVREEKDRLEPFKLVCRKVVRITDVLGVCEEFEHGEPTSLVCRKEVRFTNALGGSGERTREGGEFTHKTASSTESRSVISAANVILQTAPNPSESPKHKGTNWQRTSRVLGDSGSAAELQVAMQCFLLTAHKRQ